MMNTRSVREVFNEHALLSSAAVCVLFNTFEFSFTFNAIWCHELTTNIYFPKIYLLDFVETSEQNIKEKTNPQTYSEILKRQESNK